MLWVFPFALVVDWLTVGVVVSELLSPRNAHYDFEKEVGSGMETVFTISGADPSQKTNHMLRYVAYMTTSVTIKG